MKIPSGIESVESGCQGSDSGRDSEREKRSVESSVAPSGVPRLCVLGHLTVDIVKRDGERPFVQPGGTAYYATIAAARMGAAVRLVTRVADEDWDSRYQDAFGDLGIPVMNFPARRTTTFRNTYRTGLPDERYQDVEAVAEGFEVAQIESLRTEPCWWLLGPLTHDEIPSDVVHVMAERALGFAIDLQGYVRELHGTRVRLRRDVDARELIGLASVVKVDLNEAHVVTRERNALRAAEKLRQMGADEVLVTLGSHGSLVAWSGGIAEIGAYSEGTGVHTTGCGDTYLASYLVSRLEGRDPRYSGALASVAAGLKTRSRGPLSCNRSELDRAAEECRSLWQ